MSPTGPLYPAIAADLGGGTVSWTNVNNAKVEDGSVATCTSIGPGGGGGTPNQLGLTNFGFNIPSTATIDGITLEIKVRTTGGAAAYDQGSNCKVYLVYNGGNTSGFNRTPNSGQFWPTSALTWLTYGSSTSLWGRAWTPADINNTNFGASISAFPGTGTADITVDSVRVTVYFHTTPTDVSKRYIYKVFNSLGNYIGNLPNVTSNFGFSQDINTAGSQLSIECAVSADTSYQSTDIYTAEDGTTPYTDEAGTTNYTTEGGLPVIATGIAFYDTLIKNGNTIQVWEYGYYYPNGHCVFMGQMNKWDASFGGQDGQDTITIMCYSDGSDLDNFVARGAPFTYANDQVQTSQNASETIFTSSGGKFSGYGWSGQTFKPTAANMGAVTILLSGTATVTVQLWNSPSQTTLLATASQSVSVGSATAITFGFPIPASVIAGQNYFFSVTVDAGQSITIYYQNTDVYANGQHQTANYGGGSGGGSFGAATGDLYFIVGSSTGSTTGTYTNQDPSTMLSAIVTDYNGRGGTIMTASGSVDNTGLSLTYTFNTNTIYEALKAILSLAPDGFYYWVDLGTDTLYFKNSSTTADIVLTRGRHIEALTLSATIENVKNQVLFSGGPTAGVNLYKQYQDATSIGLYGVRLDRKSDNRVTVAATADAIGNSEIAELKDEQYQTQVTIVDKTMDITLLTPGKIIGFNGFGTFVDGLLAQIVRRDYTPEAVTLTLGILPKRLTPEFEKITRGLIAEQTVANPSAPS